MSGQMVKVEISGEFREYPVGTPYLEIAREHQKNYGQDILLVQVDNKLAELNKTLQRECKLRFVTTGDKSGQLTYRRSVVLLFLKSAHDVGGKALEYVQVLHSIGNGYYCKLEGAVRLDQDFVDRVKGRMRELVEEDVPIKKTSLSTDEAIERFKKHGMRNKERLFRYRRVSKVNLYSISGYEDYYYGYMAPSTGYLKQFDVSLFDEGLVLRFPDAAQEADQPFAPPLKLFHIFKESVGWGKKMEVGTVAALNDKIADGSIRDVILIQEALQEKKIAEIAEKIVSQEGRKIILISGPTSSGKTTFSHRLSIQLYANGMKPHPIPVDDYFVDRELTPRDENGDYNFECLEAIDVKQFNEDMANLLAGRRVELPSFNFKLGKREYKGNVKQLKEDDVLVIEGIHGLNDKLTPSLPNESKFKIYISALTQLNIDEHNRIPTTDGRLIRRIVRDARTRGASAKDTIAMWDSVRRGEEQHIFPFQEQADAMFNSALIYELAVLKQYVEPQLFAIGRDEPEYIEAKRLLKFLDYFLPVPSEDIAKNSILREFIGGSCFHV